MKKKYEKIEMDLTDDEIELFVNSGCFNVKVFDACIIELISTDKLKDVVDLYSKEIEKDIKRKRVSNGR